MLRDPLTQFAVLAIIAFLALIVAVVAIFVQRMRREFTYFITSNVTIVAVRGKATPDIKIFFREELVSQVHIVEVQFTNSGTQPITTVDYEKPVELSFATPARVLEASVSALSSEELAVHLSTDSGCVMIQPLLLNPGDWFSIRSLVADYSGDGLTVRGRIAGVQKIKATERRNYAMRTTFFGLMIATAGTIGFGHASTTLEEMHPINLQQKWFLGVTCIGYAVSAFGMLSPLLRRVGKKRAILPQFLK